MFAVRGNAGDLVAGSFDASRNSVIGRPVQRQGRPKRKEAEHFATGRLPIGRRLTTCPTSCLGINARVEGFWESGNAARKSACATALAFPRLGARPEITTPTPRSRWV
jgi:hypothetical protein